MPQNSTFQKQLKWHLLYFTTIFKKAVSKIYTGHENLMNRMKKQKDMTPNDDPSGQKVQYAPGEEQRTTTESSRKSEAAGPSQR